MPAGLHKERRLGAPQGVGAVLGRIQINGSHPLVDDPRILSRRQVRRVVLPAGKEVIVLSQTCLCDPGRDRRPSGFGDLELNGVRGRVVLEDLKVRNMTGSAKGTVEQPGHNVRQKAGLNKSILDQGWGMLKQMLGYKLQWAGGMLLLVDPAYTSQICPVCGLVDAENRKTQAVFHCQHCGHEAHADVNAAQNILARGLRPAKGLHPAGGLQSTAGHAGVACFAA
ncbi:RNA-guided endonuclease TnpB family protein [Acidithiobacillus ferrooxidans]|uniref:RNA-guided endonuclease InsQ/TnpB family protein n=1 Tax=Acidithiobacillus ferrooxidans TaxID=920 RepID=UPI00214C142B|nr:RNA-guided endonuclease TnpB family protein [Acidithiobacillus ferrooxidans]MCR2831822.1 RNA-guided endonuclease TnpB family protein [Acidithiobacillus ferrooxidans]